MKKSFYAIKRREVASGWTVDVAVITSEGARSMAICVVDNHAKRIIATKTTKTLTCHVLTQVLDRLGTEIGLPNILYVDHAAIQGEELEEWALLHGVELRPPNYNHQPGLRHKQVCEALAKQGEMTWQE